MIREVPYAPTAKNRHAPGDLAGIAHKDIQANGQNDVNHNDVNQVNIIRRQIQGQGKRNRRKMRVHTRTVPLLKSSMSSK
jgi:hypothetical protein